MPGGAWRQADQRVTRRDNQSVGELNERRSLRPSTTPLTQQGLEGCSTVGSGRGVQWAVAVAVPLRVRAVGSGRGRHGGLWEPLAQSESGCFCQCQPMPLLFALVCIRFLPGLSKRTDASHL
jgi:hypothetical protein